MAKQQVEAQAAPVIPIEKPSDEVQSTSEALAQLRLKRREESSHSSEKRTMPTIQELQAQAAPLQEHVEEVAVDAKIGTCGKLILFLNISVNALKKHSKILIIKRKLIKTSRKINETKKKK